MKDKVIHTEKTDEELKVIAADLYEGKIFTDRQCDSDTDFRMTFMPIMLGGLKDKTEDELKDIGLIYEYMSAAGPMAHDGKPIFYSCRILYSSETKRMFSFYEQYKDMKEFFLKPNEEKI